MIGQRFSFDGTRINGYWQIKDSEKPDDSIWVDCEKNILHIIIEALNNKGDING